MKTRRRIQFLRTFTPGPDEYTYHPLIHKEVLEKRLRNFFNVNEIIILDMVIYSCCNEGCAQSIYSYVEFGADDSTFQKVCAYFKILQDANYIIVM